VRNTKTYFASFNSETGLNTDVLERALVVRMKDGRDIPSEQKINISKLLREMAHHRDEIIADILYYFGKIDWATPPAKKYIAHQKCASWSETMTKILEVIYPEIDEFDYSLSDEDRAIDDDLSHLNELLDDIMVDEAKDWKFITNREMTDKFQRTFGLNERSATKVYVARRVKAMAKSVSKYRIEQDRFFDNDGKRSRGWRITKI
jgi:hypothetical protein